MSLFSKKGIKLCTSQMFAKFTHEQILFLSLLQKLVLFIITLICCSLIMLYLSNTVINLGFSLSDKIDYDSVLKIAYNNFLIIFPYLLALLLNIISYFIFKPFHLIGK